MQVTYWRAFSEGLSCFLTPCDLAKVPVRLASPYDPHLLTPNIFRKRLATFIHSHSFELEFPIVFVAFGLSVKIKIEIFKAYIVKCLPALLPC
jgi:cytochrome c biogenesis protein CcdA